MEEEKDIKKLMGMNKAFSQPREIDGKRYENILDFYNREYKDKHEAKINKITGVKGALNARLEKKLVYVMIKPYFPIVKTTWRMFLLVSLVVLIITFMRDNNIDSTLKMLAGIFILSGLLRGR